MLRDKERRLCVRIHLAVPQLRRGIFRGGWRERRRTINKDVETTECVRDLLEHFCDGSAVCKFRAEHRPIASSGPDHSQRFVRLSRRGTVMDGNPCTATAQLDSDSTAYAFCRTGD